MSERHSFSAELKRRNVYKVAIAYAVVGWLLIQVATQVFPFFEIPNWAVRLVVLAIVAGFPIALVIAWAFELTPQGLKRTEDVDLTAQGSRKRHAWIYVVIVGAALSIGLFFVGRYTARNTVGTTSELPAKSIAVLPFNNLSRDPDNAFFGEGVQDEILTRLAKVADLKVISRTSTQRFKSAPEDLRQIAKQLGVTNILEGSVQKGAIELNPNFAGAHHWYSGGPLESSGRFKEAIAEGKRGVELDPLSAVNLTDLGRIYSSARRYPEAKAVFEKAVALDPDFSYAHWHYGEMLQVAGDLKAAAAEYARARVDEKHPEPISLMGQLGAKMGRPNDAREALRVLLQLRNERSVHDYWFALLHLALNEKEKAMRCLEQSYEAGNSGYEFGIIKFDGMLDALRGEPRFEALVEKITGPKTKG